VVLNIGDELVLRPATNVDREGVKNLVFDVLREFGLEPDPSATDADLDDIEGGYIQRGGMFEVVEQDGRLLVGSVGIYPLDAQNCELRKMYLAASMRGRGLGKLLLERALDFARNAGFSSVVLETASVLKDAIALYGLYGFRPVESAHLASRADQAFILYL
jgi:putative acetyltransferase